MEKNSGPIIFSTESSDDYSSQRSPFPKNRQQPIGDNINKGEALKYWRMGLAKNQEASRSLYAAEVEAERRSAS